MKYAVVDSWSVSAIEEFDSQEEAEKAAEFLNNAYRMSLGLRIYPVGMVGLPGPARFIVGDLAE